MATSDQNLMHGEKLSEAVKAGHVDAVPGDDMAHAHSHAAHLQTEGKVHTSHEGYGKQGREPGTENQPPQDPRRNGKTHNRE
jgi:hypothetical protein